MRLIHSRPAGGVVGGQFHGKKVANLRSQAKRWLI